MTPTPPPQRKESRKRRLTRIRTAMTTLECYLLELKKRGYGPGDLNEPFQALYYLRSLARKAK